MYFLINYNRKEGLLLSLTEFKDVEDASRAKLELEISFLGSSVSNEIVVLEAENRLALMGSHSRYFKDLGSIQIEKEGDGTNK